MKKEKYNITGMSCSACSARVKKAVAKLPGMDDVTVNLLTNSMQVQYDEEQLQWAMIVAAVEKAGYGASLAQGQAAAETDGGMAPAGAICRQENSKGPASGFQAEAAAMGKRLVWSVVFLLPILYLAMHHMLQVWLGLPVPEWISSLFDGKENALGLAFTQLLLVVPILLLNRKYFVNGFRNLWQGAPNMDSLVGMGSASAAIFGIFSIYLIGWGMGHGDWQLVEAYSKNLYFESAGMIVTLITVGKYLETRAKGNTSEALRKLMDLAPKTALVLRQGQELEVPAAELVVGDEVVVRPGGAFAADGIIISGKTSVDESSITGESIPVEKQPGDRVISATLNLQGYVHFRAEKVGRDSTISQIIALVEEASSSKAPIAKMADKIAGIFVPAVISVATFATIVWLCLGVTVEFAFSIGISILVISCPCALGLATPVAIMVGTGKGAEKGILIKSGEALEAAHRIDTVVLDKTGTITQGMPQLTDLICLGESKERIVQLVASLEQASQHPLAKAITNYASQEKVSLLPVEDFMAESGLGISGRIGHKQYYVGNQRYLAQQQVQLGDQQQAADQLSDQGKTVIFLADASGLLGILAVADMEKATSKAAIADMQALGLEVIMLTGDNQRTAEAVARRLGIKRVVAQVMPQDKERTVAELQQAGHRVAMVGDGINDAPALARADVGIAIGAGTDIALESADAVLVGNNLQQVVDAINLSRAVLKNIKENLFWAFFYNIICIPLAAGVFYSAWGIKLSPMIGAAAMSMSSVCVVLNALRLKGFDFSGQASGGAKTAELPVTEEQINIIEQAAVAARKDGQTMTKELKIEGMMCQHCQKHVHEALSKMEGVTDVVVDLAGKKATVTCETDIPQESFKAVITEAGYELL